METTGTKRFMKSAINLFAFLTPSGENRANIEGIVEVANTSRTPHSFGIPSSEKVDVSTGAFSLPDNHGFYLKNNSDESVTISVKYYANGITSDSIETRIAPGWNEDYLISVDQSAEVLDLQWGY